MPRSRWHPIELWIGLVNVRPLEGNQETPSNREAFTWAISPARDSSDFEIRIRPAFEEIAYGIIEVDAGPLREKERREGLSDELRELSRQVEREGEVGIDRTFYDYPVMKAVVLAAGYATRLRPLTDSLPKMLLPLAGRPMLDYLLDRLGDVDEIQEIHLVTNSRFASAFRAWAETLQQTFAKSEVVVHDDGTTSNEDRLGAIGDLAFVIEQGGLEGDDLLVVAGDNLIGYSLPDYHDFWRDKEGSAIAVYGVANPELLKNYGVVELDSDDRIVGFEEKPPEPKSNLAATASYLYRADHLDLLAQYFDEGNPPDAPGNFVAWLYTRVPVYGYRFSGEWHDIGDLGQLLEADNLLRERAGLPTRAEYSLD